MFDDPVNDKLAHINQIYDDMNLYHNKNDLSNDDIDSDIITVLGLFQASEVDHLNDHSIITFIRPLYHFQGEEYSDGEIATRRLGDLRQILCDEILDFSRFKAGHRTLLLHMDSMSKFNIIRLGKYQLQILLYRIHQDSENLFGRPYGYNTENLREETLRLLRIREQQETKQKNNQQLQTTKPNLQNIPAPTESTETIQVVIHHNLDDDAIAKMSRPVAIQILTIYATDQDIIPRTSFFQQLNKTQLGIQIHAARDKLIIAQSLTATSIETNVDPAPEQTIENGLQLNTSQEEQQIDDGYNSSTKSNPTAVKDFTFISLNEAQRSAHNLTGVNSAKFNPGPTFRERSALVPPPAPSDTQQNENYDVVTLNRQEQYLHTRIEAKGEANAVHAPKFVEKLIFQLRKGDPPVHILPYDLGTFKSTDIVGYEKNLPTEPEKFKIWVMNMSTWKSKVIFSIRISTIDLDRVKTVIFSWCHKTSSYVKFIGFRSQRSFSPGWIYGLSPYLHNRDNFHAYIYQQEPKLQGVITVYMKEI